MADVNANPIINYTGTIPGAIQGLFADRPAVGYVPGMWYLATDTQVLYGWTGTAWVILLSNGGSGGTPTLQQVCTNGNRTNTGIRLLLCDLIFEFNNAGIPHGNLHCNTLSANRVWTLPNNTGTIALTSDIPGASTLQTVTTAGNTTNNDIELTGSNLLFMQGFLNVLQSATTAAIRTWTLPDKSGTVAMTSDIPATPTLQAVLTAGNTSTTDIFLNTTAVLRFTRGSVGTVASAILTATRTWTFPNQSGVVAMTTDIPGTPALQAVLTVGNTSTLDIFLNTTAVLKFTRTNVGSLTSASLSGAQTWTLPDNTGTIALTSDIPAVPDLETVTAVGNSTTSGIILDNSTVIFGTGAHFGELQSQTTTATRTWNLPNASGVIALQNYTANNQTGTTYTLVLSDQFAWITCSNAGTITLTIPDNATVPLPLMIPIPIEQGGAGKITVVGAGGVTLHSKGSLLSTNGQYVVISIIQKATDVWTVFGDLTT